ncbi:MAG TPA: alanine racemase [Tepidisphaeraceae bacterium]|nr:alanine racemase [Tepidisphaeraceae bacterium]
MEATLARHTLGEPRVLVSRTALLHNARVVRKAVGPAVKVCAVVKADAYGHGASLVADALCNFGNDGGGASPAVDALAVVTIDEADALPDVGGLPVMVLRPVENAFLGRQRAKLELAIRSGWTLTVCNSAAAEDVGRVALACGRRAEVQVMVDCGMTRCGVAPAGLMELLERIEALPSLRLTGIYTHFSDADDPASLVTLEQFRVFRRCTDGLPDSLRGKALRHAANSGALFFHPATHLDIVRPGLALYGIDPTGRPSTDRPLRPALKWTAPLVSTIAITKGTCVGYGQTWRATHDTRIGVVAVGYADGYPRCYSNRAAVMLHGRPAPVVGRVSMDLTTIDLAHHPQAVVGDEVTLLDSDPLSPASVYRLAEWADTIPYEVLCRIGPRVHRVPVEPDDLATWHGHPARVQDSR